MRAAASGGLLRRNLPKDPHVVYSSTHKVRDTKFLLTVAVAVMVSCSGGGTPDIAVRQILRSTLQQGNYMC